MLKGMFKKNSPVVDAGIVQEYDGRKKKPEVPSGLWIKCSECNHSFYKKDIEAAMMVCPSCGNHFRMSSTDRLRLIADEGTFDEWDKKLSSVNPLEYPGYADKIKKLEEETGISEAIITGLAKVGGIDAVLGIMDSRFLMGSMGSVVGEKVTRVFERATEKKLPVILFTASGGARMQEGIFSLMQMAKTSAAIGRHNEAGLLYITVLTDPTTGGVTASFAMLGDIIISEPGTLIGFAGPRVIEQTIRQKLPAGFQRAEFLLDHGFVDMIVERKDMKQTLSKLLSVHVSSSWTSQDELSIVERMKNTMTNAIENTINTVNTVMGGGNNG